MLFAIHLFYTSHTLQKCPAFDFRYLRAVAYRWTVRWIFGYLGWDSRRPLPACVYTHIQAKYPSNAAVGFAAAED